MNAADPAVVVDRLVKSYGGRRVVDELSFAAAPGELLALLGPNGAGKTTTVEILEGYRRPDGGLVRVLGLDPVRQAGQLKPRIGIMLQQGGVYPSSYPLEVLELYASFFVQPLDPRDLLRQVGLEDAARTPFRRLSGGQKQRLLLALAVVGQPELLFLDEPTAAMDPQARQATWELIRSLKQQGVTILLTTHQMDEAERLADRVAIVDHGRLVALDTPRGLIDGPAEQPREVRFATRPALELAGLAAALRAPQVIEEAPGRYLARVRPDPARIADLAAWLRDQDALLSELRVGNRSLEDVFLSLTGRELRD